MKPVSPVYEDAEELWGVKEVTYAKDQPEYLQLPALKFLDGLVVSRWKLSFIERLAVLLTGNIFLGVLTFNQDLQPVRLSTNVTDVCGVVSESKSV